MVSPLEAAVQRVITKGFISANLVVISLSRPTLVDDGAGGKTMTWISLPPQNFRIIPQGGSGILRTVDGKELSPEFVLVGYWDADVKKGDRFVIDGVTHEVIWILPDSAMSSSYETKAEVVSRG